MASATSTPTMMVYANFPDGTPLEFDYVTVDQRGTPVEPGPHQGLLGRHWRRCQHEERGRKLCSSMAPAAATPVSGSSSATSRCSPTVRRSLIHASYLQGTGRTDRDSDAREQLGAVKQHASHLKRGTGRDLGRAQRCSRSTILHRNDLVIRVNDLISAESGGVIPLISRGSVSAKRQRDSRPPARSTVGTVNTGTSTNGPASRASSL